MNQNYMFGFLIGIILAGWIFSKIGLWICKKYYNPQEAIYQSVMFTSAAATILGSFHYGFFVSFLVYVPSVFVWHYVALRKLQRNLSS